MDKRTTILLAVLTAIVGPIIVYYFTVGRSVLPSGEPEVPQEFIKSPDGKYGARRIGKGNDQHYEISDISQGTVLFKTRAAYNTKNDVKLGKFSNDSTEFAALYHYATDGPHTYIPVFSLPGGSLIREITKTGYVREFSGVFKN